VRDPEHCLYSLAYHAGKKSITANLDRAESHELIANLAAHADFLIESHPLGYLDSIGLGYDALARRNRRLIYTSIMPFGDTGPGKNYNWADIVSWAAGGMMYLMGEQEKPPLQMSLPQAGLHAGAEAAVASLLAHYPRQSDDLGQRIVVNMQACFADRCFRRLGRCAPQDGLPVQRRICLDAGCRRSNGRRLDARADRMDG
jgi:crotonobetainyl-CoA:carnitine CoA-transferase CaiB-like acyl-CoA transferase